MSSAEGYTMAPRDPSLGLRLLCFVTTVCRAHLPLLFPCSLPGQRPQLWLFKPVLNSHFPDWPVAPVALGEPPQGT